MGTKAEELQREEKNLAKQIKLNAGRTHAAAGDDPDADDLAAAETTVGDEPQAVEVTYRLTHGDDGWRLDETPTDEVERLWFEYALVLP